MKAIKLPEEFNSESAEDLKKQLLKKLKDKKKAVIDASAVQEIHTSSLQVLLSAQKTFEKKKVDFEIKNPSEFLDTKFQKLGIWPYFKREEA